MKRSLFVLLGALLAFQQNAYADGVTPVWMSVQHDIVDLEAWRIVFDDALDARKRAGELSYQINTFSANPNTVVAVFKWASTEQAEAFVNDPMVRDAMRGAGIVSELVVSVYENPMGGPQRP